MRELGSFVMSHPNDIGFVVYIARDFPLISLVIFLPISLKNLGLSNLSS